MHIPCKKCGAVACVIETPEVSRGEAFATKKMISGLFGEEAATFAGVLLNPTADGIRDLFNVTCPPCARPVPDPAQLTTGDETRGRR